MPSERLQRQVDKLLDDAENAVSRREWDVVRECCDAVLRVDPENSDAKLFLQMAGESGATANSVEAPTPNLIQNGTAASEPSIPNTPPVSEEPGDFADGRYEVKKFLGEGGKKKVYLAYDRTLDREIAFSLIKTDGLDDIGRERIKREAQAMGRMGTHPCVMPIYDLGEENGQPFMVGPVMGGGDVEGLIEDAEGPVELTRAIDITRQTAEGLAFAHSKGIVHRDIKPGNVWMDTDGSVKVGDFGLAVATDRSRLTIEKMMVGTVSYMPPEQATGGEVTPRADIYSLGAMLYEMCAGRPPFLGDDEIAIITQHVNTPPVAPSWHNNAIPQSLDSLILRMMSKDPSERPQTAEEVIEGLDGVDLSVQPASESNSDSLNRVPTGLFVGRREIMDQLKNAFEETMSGRGRMVALVGQPGIGKTRTSQELQTYAGMRGAKIIWGRCHEGGGAPPYWPWIQAVKTFISDKNSGELRRLLGGNAAVMSDIVPDIKEHLPEVQSPVAIDDPDSARFRLFDSVAGFLSTASHDEPLVIILDDLHWADRSSLLLLEYVVKELRNSRVLLIGNYRDVEINRRHPLAISLGELTRESLFERIHLDGLRQHEVKRFIEESSGVEAPDPLVNTVYAQTEGNPLFMTETVNLLVQEGNLTNKPIDRRTQSWEISIPESVREVVGRRLDKLSEDCYDALSHAALIGREFRMPVLTRLLADTSEDRLLDLLDEALDARIIEESPSDVGLYQFKDPMMLDALVEEMSLTRRVRFHARIAEAIEDYWGRDADEHAAELAHHYQLAEPVSGTEKLVHYVTIAGNKALDSLAFNDAEQHFSSLLQALEKGRDDPQRADALLGQAKAYTALAMHQEAVESTEQAFEIFARIGDRDKAIAVARSLDPLGNREARVFESARRLAVPGSSEDIDLLARHARSQMGSNPTLASKEIAEAIALAEKIGDEDLLMVCSSSAASIDGMAGHWDPTLENSLRSIDLAQKNRNSYGEWLGHVWAANSYSATGQPAKADEHARQAIRVADATRNYAWRGAAMGGDARTDAFRGRWASALKNVDEGLKLDPEDTRLIIVGIRVQMEQGNFDKIKEVREHPDEPSLHVNLPSIYAMAALATGSPEYAREARARFDTQHPDGISKVNSWAASNHALALLTVIESDVEAAGRLIEQFEYWSGWITHQMISGDRILGLLAATAGDKTRAEGFFEKAISLCEPAGYRPELAWSCVNLAELLIVDSADDRREDIEKLQDTALQIATELEMKPVVERVLSSRELLKA